MANQIHTELFETPWCRCNQLDPTKSHPLHPSAASNAKRMKIYINIEYWLDVSNQTLCIHRFSRQPCLPLCLWNAPAGLSAGYVRISTTLMLVHQTNTSIATTLVLVYQLNSRIATTLVLVCQIDRRIATTLVCQININDTKYGHPEVGPGEVISTAISPPRKLNL